AHAAAGWRRLPARVRLSPPPGASGRRHSRPSARFSIRRVGRRDRRCVADGPRVATPAIHDVDELPAAGLGRSWRRARTTRARGSMVLGTRHSALVAVDRWRYAKYWRIPGP